MSEPLVRIGQVANLETRLANVANTVRVSQNGSSTLSSKQLNFVNTGNITIAVTDSGDGNANIAFDLTTGGGTLSNIAISSNGVFAVNANAFNFVNTSTVSVTVQPGINGNANISFTSSGGTAGGSAAVKDVFAGNGTTDTFTLTVTPVANSYTLVFVDRVYQETSDYRLNGSQLEFLSGPPPANSVVEVFTYFGTAQPGIVLSDLYVGTGACTQYILSQTCTTDRTLVYLNGVSQRPQADYQVNGATLTLNAAPALNTNVEIRTIGISATANVNVPVTFMTDVFTGTGSCTQFTMSQAGTTNSTFVFLNGISQKPLTDFYVANGVITFTTAPANGVQVEARSAGNFSLIEIDQSRVDSDVFTGDGACTSFTLTVTTSTAKAFVYIDGVSQKPYIDYIVNGQLLDFVSPPDNGSSIEVRTLSEFKFITDNSTLAYAQANLAYNQANSARTTANSAYNQANAAYAVANVASAAANTRVLRAGDTMTGVLNIANTISLVTTGRVGVQNTNPQEELVVGDYTNGYPAIEVNGTTEPTIYLNAKFQTNGFNSLIYNSFGNFAIKLQGFGTYSTTDNFIIRYQGVDGPANAYTQFQVGGSEAMRLTTTGVGIGTTTPTSKLHIVGTTTLEEVLEKSNVTATAMGANVTLDVLDCAVVVFTANSTANSTVNIRGNSTVALNSVMSTNQSLTIVFAATNGATAYRVANLQIDGTTVTPKWSGGTAPTASANSIDAYTFTVIKTASATYTVLGSKTQFA